MILDLRILKELRVHFLDLRILQGLRLKGRLLLGSQKRRSPSQAFELIIELTRHMIAQW
jgi:hypothetical protein